MKNATDQIASIEEMIRNFWECFMERPGMLGSPEELSSIFFYIDQVEYLMLGGGPGEYWERSWVNFLVHRKLIVGGRNVLKEELQKEGAGYVLLQDLRREYLDWRSAAGRWPEGNEREQTGIPTVPGE